MFSPKKSQKISEVKLRIFFENFFLHNSKTDKDIFKIPTDLSSAGQQLKNSNKYENSMIL